jgi:uncharacterized phage protein (TIGR02218 family)
MRAFPPELAASLASGVTTLCLCWTVMRSDGQTFGFTNHDRDIPLGTLVCAARTGLDAGEAESAEGLAAPAAAIAGALVAEAITDGDIAAGLWDGATVETWLVDWSAPASRALLDIGRIGEVTRSGSAFRAEVRGVAADLDQERGRRYGSLCDAELGDQRCGAPLAAPSRRAETSVTAASTAGELRIATPGAIAAGALAGGTLAFTGGANAGRTLAIQGHARNSDGSDTLVPWSPPPLPVLAGDTVRVTVGCDKSFTTCHGVFGNAQNFRGFPHIPGNDHVISYARTGASGQDGGPVRP